MTPEAPGNLVVLDLSLRDGELTGNIERVSPPQEGPSQGALRVRFDARTKEPGFYSVGAGVAWVSQPTGYVHSTREPAGLIPSAGDLKFYYNHVAYGEGLMVVLVLPKGYTLADSSPPPRGAKEFRGRIAVYLKPSGSFGSEARVAWTLKQTAVDLKVELQTLHGKILSAGATPVHFGAMVDDEDPMKPKNGSSSPSIWDYWWISLSAAALGIALLLVDIYKGGALPATVQNLVYLVVLLITAVACSIALFGILRSKAHITYKNLGTVVELSGAAALFALIVYVGLGAKGSNTFDLTVRVYHPDQSIVTSGSVDIDLGTDRRNGTIGPNGEANFKRIPPEFAERKINVFPHVTDYEEKSQELQIVEGLAQLTLVKANPEVLLRGSVHPFAAYNKLVVRVEGQDNEATVDQYGEFKLVVKGKTGDRVRLRVYLDSQLIYDDFQNLPGPVNLSLAKPTVKIR
jgi:hypothetical protein